MQLRRNILDACPKALQDSLHNQLRALFAAPDPEIARQLLRSILAAYGVKASQAMQRLETGFDDASAVLSYPEPYRNRLGTTNIVERLNEEIRRRERVIRIFPNAVHRLLSALLSEIDEPWSTGRKYFDMAAYWDWRRPRATATD